MDGWLSDVDLRQCCALAEQGYVAATATYRLAPAHPWPAQLDDVLAAVAWLREHASDLGLDPARLVIAGTSAGGHLAALAALDPGAGLAGAILWYPAVDLAVVAEHEVGPDTLAGLFGKPPTAQQLRAASPTHRVSPGCPPVLTLTGELDEITPPWTAKDFTAGSPRPPSRTGSSSIGGRITSSTCIRAAGRTRSPRRSRSSRLS